MGGIIQSILGIQNQPPPPPPMPDPAKISAEAEAEARKKARMRSGRQKTIIAGDLGQYNQPPDKTLLGA